MNEARYQQICFFLEGKLDQSAIEDLERWRTEHPENEIAFEQVKFIWEKSFLTQALEDIQGEEMEKESIEVALAKVKKNFKVKKSPKITRRRVFVSLVAAAAAILMFIGYFIIPSQNGSPEYLELITGAGEERKFTLSDESVVWLGSNSRLRYPEKFSSKERRVFGKGDLIFKVSHQNSQPFFVETDKLEVKVLGTKFIVEANQEMRQTNVGVLSGKVKVAEKAGPGQLFLEKGMAASLDDTQKGLYENKEFDFNRAFKTSRQLVFDDVLLETVFKDLEKAYQVEIEVVDKNLLSCRFKGEFKDQKIEQALELLSLVYEFKIESDELKQFKILNGLCN